MDTKGKTSINANKTKVTAATLMRLAGVSAMVTGLSIIVIGIFHPLNIPSAVNTDAWVNVHIFATALGFFGLFGMTGFYARQVEESGWLGLIGFLLLSAWMTLVGGFSFVEAFIEPVLMTESPAFVASLMGMFTSMPSEIDLGILPTLWNISGLLIILGPLLFGIATFRARVLPRWAGALLALVAVLVPLGGMVPPEYQPEFIMIPLGLAVAWLGYALFSERREQASQSLIAQRTVISEPSKVA
jgi:hypothetical protein